MVLGGPQKSRDNSLALCSRSPPGNFAICFLLEILLREFPFQFLKNTEYLKTTQILCFKGFHLKRKSPHEDLNQETYRKHPVLVLLPMPSRYRCARPERAQFEKGVFWIPEPCCTPLHGFCWVIL